MNEINDQKHAVETAVRARLALDGMTMRDLSIDIDWDDRCVMMRRPPIGLETVATDRSGNRMIVRKIGLEVKPSAIKVSVDRFVGLAIGLKARKLYIKDRRQGPAMEPDWSVLIEPTAKHLLSRLPIDNDVILTPYWTNGGQHTAGRHGFTVGGIGNSRMMVQTEPGRSYPVSGFSIGLSAGVLTIEKIRIGDGPVHAVYEGGRQSRIVVTETSLPQTLLTALTAKKVSEAIDHPIFKGCEGEISSARLEKGNNGHDLVINLKRRLVPFAPAPEGVDTEWLKMIEGSVR